MGGELTDAERSGYRRDGFFVRTGLFAADELKALREAVERVHERICAASAEPDPAPVERIDDKRYQRLLDSLVKWEWQEGRSEIRSMEPCLHLDPRLERLPDDPRLARPAAELSGADRLSLFTDKLNFKRPGGAPFPWHQDSPYWAFGCDHLDRLASVQLYLDDATRENGCLWILAGSHRHGALPVREDRGVLGRLYTDVSRVEERRERAIEAPAGSAVFFHGDVVHGSRSNASAASRRALVLTYQPAGLPRWNRRDVRDIAAG
ncbi:MAG: phytanoyl-CoA dioxygenase family protein [Proteobacteria bacterium]|nr:phytanoyl-CoA dioxygenase family protein [Pseudomonadota bacterium]